MDPQKTPSDQDQNYGQSGAFGQSSGDTSFAGSGMAPGAPAPAANSTDPMLAGQSGAAAAATESPEPPVQPGQTFVGNTASPEQSAPAESAGPSQYASPPNEPADKPQVFTGMQSDDPLPIKKKGKGKKKGLILGLIIAAAVLLLSGGAAASYYLYIVPNKPENVLKQALANSLDPEKVKTTHSTGTLISGDDEMTIETTYSIKADNQSGAFDITSKADALVTNLTLDARSTDGKTLYFKVGGLEGLSDLFEATGDVTTMTMFSEAAPFFDLVNDQWIEVNQSLLKQTDPAFASTVLSDADKDKVAQAYLQNPFLVIKEVMADEEINGQSSHHYKLVIDPAVLKSFVAALKEANIDFYKIEQEQVDEINKAIDQAKFDKYPFEVWIAKKTKLFTQFRLESTDEGVKTDIKHTIDSYNEPVEVEKPEDSKSVLEIIGEFSKAFSDEYGDLFSDPELPDGNGISL